MVKQQHLFPLWWQTKSKIPGQVTAQKTTTCSVRVFKSIFPACVHHGFCFQIKLAERAWKPWNCLYLFSGLCDLQPGVHRYGIHQQGVRISQRWETNMMCWVNTQRIQIQVTKRHKPDTVSMHTGFFFFMINYIWQSLYVWEDQISPLIYIPTGRLAYGWGKMDGVSLVSKAVM